MIQLQSFVRENENERAIPGSKQECSKSTDPPAPLQDFY